MANKPESQEPGMAESDYMSIEQREKFEAGHVPEKVEPAKPVSEFVAELHKQVERYDVGIGSNSLIRDMALEACDRLESAEKEMLLLKRPMEVNGFKAEGMMAVGQALIDKDLKIKQLQAKALKTIKEIEGDLFVGVVDPVYSLSVLAMGQAEEIKQLEAKLEAALKE